MSPDYDAIVIGAGHNGLVAAAYLAKAGQRTLLLEQRSTLGGAAASEEIFPGFRVDTGAHDAGGFGARIAGDLNLSRRGLAFLEAPAHLLALLPGGEQLTLWRDPTRARASIHRFSPKDAQRYPDFLAAMARLRGVLDAMSSLAPPTPAADIGFRELFPWLRLALRVRRLGRRDMMEMLRAIPLSAAEFLEEWFEAEPLRGALGSAGVAGSMQGPMASGTAFMMFYAGLPEGPFRAARFVVGGMGRLSEALAAAARGFGAEIRRNARVQGLLATNGRATGVILKDGREISANTVLSSANPRTTLLDLIGPPALEVRVVRRVKNIRFRGSTAKVNLAVSRLPAFRCHPEPQALSGHILLCPSLEYLERAYDDAKYGRFSAAPFLDVTIPTVLDARRAPEGQHLLSINTQYAPYELRGSTWEQQRDTLGDAVIAALAEHAPDLPDLILHRQVITPQDYEQEYDLPEGSIFHGQMGLDQLLFMRPIPGFGSYRSPLEGLFFCGSGAHPGGGVTGAPGRNAARQALKQLSKR